MPAKTGNTTTQQMQVAKAFAAFWADKGDEKQETSRFWIDLLQNVLGIDNPAKYIEFEKRVKLQHTSFIDAYIPATKVLIEQKSAKIDLHRVYEQSDGATLTPYEQAKRYADEMPNSLRPRWIVVCNFQEFLVYDLEKPGTAPEQIFLKDIEKEHYRLQFLADARHDYLRREEELSLQAGVLVGKLYDALIKQYFNPKDEQSLRSLNILCVRLVFCLYAEDAGLFATRTAFEDYIRSFSIENTRDAIIKLFKALDTKSEDRDRYDTKLAAFPYVNGGLFAAENIEIPNFTDEIVDVLCDHCAPFNWSDISPTIFGAVFESTLNPETRRRGGMHYTSVQNIHKVIDPLFMDALTAEFEVINADNVRSRRAAALQQFQQKLGELTFLDPACGSGNFLTETYLSLRRLENRVISVLNRGEKVLGFDDFIHVKINQFYGIEINDFAVTVAKTALWIAESQMIRETESILSQNIDFLPLTTNAYIVEGNALRMDWATLKPTDTAAAPIGGLFSGFTTETDGQAHHYDYIIGNPPFVGYSLQNEEQKNDILSIYVDEKGKPYKTAGKIDYVAGWYFKAVQFIKGTSTRCALVSTNSITQGEQVAGVWRPLFERFDIQIDFAWRTFRWDSESNQKAHVHCVIVGFSCRTADVCRKADGPSANVAADVCRKADGSSANSTSANAPNTPNAAPIPDWHYRGYIPHRENKSLQFITYRLYDSVPAHVIKQWKEELGITETTDSNDPKAQKLRNNIAKYEDAGYGQCFMKNDEVAQIIQDNLLHFNGERYWLHNWCIMPNHVHLLIEVKEGWTLSTIMHGWRSYTAKAANKALGRTGQFWKEEYFDRFIRDEEHYWNVMSYIDNNPINAGLEDWKWCRAMADDGLLENTEKQLVARDAAAALHKSAIQSQSSVSETQAIASESQASRLRSDIRSDIERRIFNPDSTIEYAQNINAYLLDAPNVWIEGRNKPLCDVPQMTTGNRPADGGHLIIEADEYVDFIKREPNAEKWIKKLTGAEEYINNKQRYCLWLVGASPAEIKKMPEVLKRIEKCKADREASPDAGRQKLAEIPHLFRETKNFDSFIITPAVSSERRTYVPLGFLDRNTIPTNLVQIIPNATLYHFGVLTSSVHMAWMRAVCGRLKSDYRYSKDIVYNNFVWPMEATASLQSQQLQLQQSKQQRDAVASIERTAQAILDARALYPDSSLADLYDATLMPVELRRAHRANDEAVLAAYGWPKNLSESEIVERLFALYQERVAAK